MSQLPGGKDSHCQMRVMTDNDKSLRPVWQSTFLRHEILCCEDIRLYEYEPGQMHLRRNNNRLKHAVETMAN